MFSEGNVFCFKAKTFKFDIQVQHFLKKLFIVQIYDSPESDLKLNDVFEFIGILTFDTDIKDDKTGQHEPADLFQEEDSVNLPPSKVRKVSVFALSL